MSASTGARGRTTTLLLLLAVAALIFAVRSLGVEWVFVGDEVVFPPADPQYHLRRAFFTFVNFPDVLLFDPYINHPGGASVPWPPLYDFGLGSVAWLLADDQGGFEAVVAWAGPCLAALGTIPIYLTTRCFAPRYVGVLAGSIFAFLPLSVSYSRVGNVDHHAAVGLIGALLLYCCVRLADDELDASGERRLGALLYGVRLVLLLTWHGSLLYLAIAEACLLIVGIGFARPGLLRVQALSALAVVVTIAPMLALMPTPLGGDYSSIALSRLHLLAMLGVAVVAGSMALLARREAARPPLFGFALAGAIGLAYLVALVLVPATRAGLVPALSFLTMTDGMGHVTGEQTPIFGMFGRAPGRPPELSWGWFAWLIPIAPAAALAWLPERGAEGGRATAQRIVLAIWGGVFGALALGQRRYGNDFAASASVLFALGLSGLARVLVARVARASDRPPGSLVAPGLAVLLTFVLLWPALARFHWPRLEHTRAWLADDPVARQATEQSIATTLTRFAKGVRGATPETSGFTAAGRAPEYGVIAHPNLGHALQYAARRATATDPFWAYIGQENWDRTRAFLRARDEASALALARELDGRYVVTMPDAPAGSVSEQLHRADGLAVDGRPALSHFRLILEADPSGQAIGEIFARGPAGAVPYKLFEIVEGARLAMRGEPGTLGVAELDVWLASGRHLAFVTRAVLDASGHAEVRLPYATTAETGPYRVRIGPKRFKLRVAENAVRSGALTSLPPTSEAAPAKL